MWFYFKVKEYAYCPNVHTLVQTCICLSEKVQAEIDRVIGQSRQPCLDDRVNMPYTEAVLHEIQRFGDVVPLGFPKQAAVDTKIGNYFIPKVLLIYLYIYSISAKSEQMQ